MKSLFVILALTLCIGLPAISKDNKRWYEPITEVGDHDNDPDFNFLLGNWVSTDRKELFAESWSRASTHMLVGVRTQGYGFGSDGQYDLIVFERSRTGAYVTMRRMMHRLNDKRPDYLLGGSWSIPTTHRGIISCSSFSGDLKTIASYDSPSPDLLDLQIETKTKVKSIKKTIHMKRALFTEPTR